MATEVDALVVKLEADIASFRADMATAGKLVAQSASSIEKSLADMSKQSGGAFKFLRDAAATAAGFLASQAVLGAIRTTTAAMRDFFVDGIAEATAKEDAIQRLNSALAASGKYTKEASAEMVAYANSLEGATRFGDDLILQASALIQSLGRLGTKELKEATKATLDLSTALGIDLNTAAMMVGKAATGNIDTFKRYGVVITEGKDKTETFRNTLDALSRQFGGSAVNAVKTFSGAAAQISNAWGDLQGEVAGTVTQSGALVGTMNVLSRALGDTADWVKKNRAGLQELVRDGIILLADGIPLAVNALGALNSAFSKTYQFGQSVKGLFNMDIFGKVMDPKKDEEITRNIRESQLAEESRAKTIEDLTIKATALRDQIVKAAEDGSAAQAVYNETLNKQTQLADLNMASTTALAEAQNTRLLASIEAGQKLLEEEEIQNTDHLALLEDRYAYELAALQKARDNELLTEEQFIARKAAMTDKFESDRTRVEKAEAEARYQIQQRSAAAMSGIFGNLAASLADTQGKGFEAYKAFASAQALIDTYAAANAAYKSAMGIPVIGPTIAPIAAAAAVAAGLTNVARIGDAKPKGFAKGGEVPGIGFGDSVPAMLTPGETVVDRSTTGKLKNFLSGESQIISELQALRAQVAAMGSSGGGRLVVTDQFGRVIFDVINEQLRAGRKLAGV